MRPFSTFDAAYSSTKGSEKVAGVKYTKKNHHYELPTYVRVRFSVCAYVDGPYSAIATLYTTFWSNGIEPYRKPTCKRRPIASYVTLCMVYLFTFRRARETKAARTRRKRRRLPRRTPRKRRKRKRRLWTILPPST